MYDFTVGTDAEFFLKKPLGSHISGHGIIPGTKDKPHFFKDNTSCQLDGVALEIGIPPARTAMMFDAFIKRALDNVEDQFLKKNKVLLDRESTTVFFDKEYYDKEIPEECKVLGCTPDRDAYKDGAINIPPTIIHSDKGVMRTAGGHIHIGWTKVADPNSQEHIWDCVMLIKNLDFIYTMFEPWFDHDTTRRQMYGKPGCFRTKTYGVEYRTPSTAWTKSIYLRKFVFCIAQYAFYATVNGVSLERHFSKGFDKKNAHLFGSGWPDVRYDRGLTVPPPSLTRLSVTDFGHRYSEYRKICDKYFD